MSELIKPLVLPHEHPLSLRLAAQAEEFQSSLANSNSVIGKSVLNCRLLSPGLVELIIQAGRPGGYGSRTWVSRLFNSFDLACRGHVN